VTDALRHIPHCLAYMGKLRDRDIFRFCAIPQIMAAGTLALCYNNGGVFEGAPRVKQIRTAGPVRLQQGFRRLQSRPPTLALRAQRSAQVGTPAAARANTPAKNGQPRRRGQDAPRRDRARV
jgi:hypothetical protein